MTSAPVGCDADGTGDTLRITTVRVSGFLAGGFAVSNDAAGDRLSPAGARPPPGLCVIGWVVSSRWAMGRPIPAQPGDE
jgi:hypothetical protein